MSAAVADLEAGLQAMLTLKPPGVSGTRIQSITALCTANVQSESVLIQKLYTHFKKAPGTHKLGVLYVVDSVTRKWTELAKAAGQPINTSAQDGSFAAGVHRVKELLPVLMNDIIQTSPNDQKEKIKKLVDIWEKGQTFPLQMLTQFKEKLNAVEPQSESTTPPGSPPVDLRRALGLQQDGSISTPPPTAAPNTSSILEALANMARQSGQGAPNPPALTQPQENSYNMPIAQSNPAPQIAANRLQFPPIPPSVNVPTPMATFAQQLQGGSNGVQASANNQTLPFAAPSPVVSSPFNALDPTAQQQLMLIKALADQGFTPDKIAGVITAMGSQGLAPPPPPVGAGGFPPPPPQFAAQNQNGWGSRSEESRDHIDPVRSPHGRFGGRRSRSRSPVNTWNARDSPNSRRREPDFDFGDRNRGGDRGRGRGSRGGGMDDYRQRSPARRRSPSPLETNEGGKKWIEYDNSIPKGSIKVLSRTLFVGGVTTSEQELRSLFEQYGKVQTCIVNKEKRHAFVKMISRQDAVTAKSAMESGRAPDSQLRTRWGVGFGPRDCSDYQSGISVIPISKLTDADRKWMLTAEYGGSGGQSIESGMVVEEPDIEIGQGVSSKAISRRMQTDKGGNNGPKSTRDRDEEEGSRFRRHDRDDRRDTERQDRFSKVSAPPSMPAVPPFGMPGFPFTMPTLPNGMPMFPPGFPFPGQTPTQPPQPPPPGRS